LAPSGFFLFGYAKGKLMAIALKLRLNFLLVFGLFWRNPAGDLERSFPRMDGVIAKMRAGRW
jgi:hypothetical protein